MSQLSSNAGKGSSPASGRALATVCTYVMSFSVFVATGVSSYAATSEFLDQVVQGEPRREFVFQPMALHVLHCHNRRRTTPNDDGHDAVITPQQKSQAHA